MAAAERQQNILPQNYNLKLGPATMSASTGVSVEFNDNISLAENHRESDLIIRPEIRLNTEWRMSTLNTLRLTLGAGVAEYLNHSEFSNRTILVDPGSEISFNVYLGDFVRLNFHDRLSIVRNPIDEPALSNAVNFDRLQNAAGVTAFLDFDQLKFLFGYDHFDYQAIGSEFKFLNHREEQFFSEAMLQISEALNTGVDGSFGLINYDEGFNNNGLEWSAGPFVEATLSRFTKVRITGGVQGMAFDDNGTNGDHSDLTGWYGSLTVSHRFNQYWSHALTVGHEAQLGLTTNYVDYTYARYVADWRMNQRIHFSFEGFLGNADESGGTTTLSENSFRWGAGVSTGYAMNSRLSLSLQYRYVNKDSNLPLRSYYQNSLVLSASYNF